MMKAVGEGEDDSPRITETKVFHSRSFMARLESTANRREGPEIGVSTIECTLHSSALEEMRPRFLSRLIPIARSLGGAYTPGVPRNSPEPQSPRSRAWERSMLAV